MKRLLGLCLAISLCGAGLAAKTADSLPPMIMQLASIADTSTPNISYASPCCSEGGWLCGVAPNDWFICCYHDGREVISMCKSN